MPNPFFGEFHKDRARKIMAVPDPGMKAGGKGAFKEKPAFPPAGVPGKTQPRDRSAGVTRVQCYPKSEGL